MELTTIIRLLLPAEITEHFDLVEIKEEQNGKVIFCLDEKLIYPKEHSDKALISKGYHDKVEIQDFPLRGKPVYFHVRRRKWTDKNTKKVYSTTWDLTANGTSYTKEFAAFLKELLR